MSPGPELDVALLLVEWEPGEVQLAAGGEHVGGDPEDLSCTFQHNLEKFDDRGGTEDK